MATKKRELCGNSQWFEHELHTLELYMTRIAKKMDDLEPLKFRYLQEIGKIKVERAKLSAAHLEGQQTYLRMTREAAMVAVQRDVEGVPGMTDEQRAKFWNDLALVRTVKQLEEQNEPITIVIEAEDSNL